MGFEVFVKQGRIVVRDPAVTIMRNGQMRFNRACDEKWVAPKGATHILLLFDREKGLIGLRPCGDGVENAYPLRVSKAGRCCSATSFLRFYEVDFSKTRVYPATWNEEVNAIVLELRAGKETGGSAGKKSTGKT